MNTRLRNSLSALAVAASMTSLGFALGEPPRPSDFAAELGADAVAAMAQPTAPASGTPTAAPRANRAHVAMPFFSFGKRASAGAP